MKLDCSELSFRAKIMPQSQAQYFKNELLKSKSVDIVCHTSTDSDSLCSAVAISDYLTNLGVQNRIIASKSSKNIEILRGNTKITDTNEDCAPTVLCVDFSSKNRATKGAKIDYNNSKILCFDHHKTPPEDLIIQPKETKSPIYIDNTAQSNTSIIYRFFEALDEDIDNKTAYNLFSGFVSDGQKRELLICDGNKKTITPTKKLKNNKEAFEIYWNLKNELTGEQIEQIAEKYDIINSLNSKEKSFYDSLKDKIKFAKNGKFAYIAIKPDDKTWEELGKDNKRTSSILREFRLETLNKSKNIQAVFTFYPTENSYRFSAHANDKFNLLDYINYISEKYIPNFNENAGGHHDRAGGGMQKDYKGNWEDWIQTIVNCE